MNAPSRYAGCLLFTALLSACTPAPEVRRFSGTTMGTTYQVTYVAWKGAEPSQTDIEEVLHEINQSASNYIETSMISRLNMSRDTSAAHTVDGHFTALFRRSREIYDDTGGAFNPALGPLIDAWGFGPKQPLRFPDDAMVRALLKASSFDTFGLQESPAVVRKRIAEAQLDFGGIAKGYAVDTIAKLLNDSDVQDFLVEIAGEVRAQGKRADGSIWQVGIERPAEDALAEPSVQIVVGLENAALSTSGNYRNLQEDAGRKVGHILNPRTGYPAMNSLLSATVMAPNAMTADAYATALMVMGLDEALQFVESHKELSAYFIAMDSAGGIIEKRSSRFPKDSPSRH